MRGTLSSRKGYPFGLRDHPRVCGEHWLSKSRHAAFVGSSPRMRGTPQSLGHLRCVPGIIPAYAGNTISVSGFAPAVMGSSPRMRGTLAFSATDANDAGIIPAYAGNTLVRARALRCVGDHPRVCGEHLLLYVGPLSVMGSSPRMRGTP